MRKKFTLKEGEVQRILGLHKQAILKENNYQILNEQQTFSLKINTDFDPSSSNSDEYDLRLYKGTTFKLSTKIKNYFVTNKQEEKDRLDNWKAEIITGLLKNGQVTLKGMWENNDIDIEITEA